MPDISECVTSEDRTEAWKTLKSREFLGIHKYLVPHRPQLTLVVPGLHSPSTFPGAVTVGFQSKGHVCSGPIRNLSEFEQV